MRDFLDAALGFPAVLFSFALIVVIGFWLLVATGVVDAGEEGGLLGGLPALAISGFVAVGWFAALAGTVLFPALGWVILAAALVVGFGAAVLVRRLTPTPEKVPSRHDFVGQMCVIRTQSVSTDFGQAEVRAVDGSTAVIQVRQTGTDTFNAGGAALIFQYDTEGEFFWVMPYERGL
ncbi:hypothetical protein [Herbidospora mongoliensis]|uniref:hypothetical protein n=1 Tax=Herbidospora mongoliensis TaxID=688067 RepID=UPI000833E7F7|nr:hypothetical protein [Herbidospora mongoliensis]